jgi:RHS repeat-associated protein
MNAAGVIAHYVMDGDRPLTAETGGNTNFYLYGLGAIGEKTTAWSYSLPDGTNTPRQLTDVQGEITLSARYTPWADTLETYGTGNFSFGYLGGVLDATTGLLYVGNGQYYDPATGRFLTRNVNPDSANPYVPWNPIGAIVGPLGLIALVFGRKKKGSKAGTFLVLVLVAGSVGMTLAGCGGQPLSTTPTVPVYVTSTVQDGVATITFTPTPVPPSPTPTLSINIPLPFPYDPSLAVEYAMRWANGINPQFGEYPGTDCANFVSQAILSGINGSLPDTEWSPGSLAWVGVPALYKFLSQRFAQSVYTNDKSASGYHYLRGYPKWENEFLQVSPIQPGDIAFYWDENVAFNIDPNYYPLNEYPDRYTHTAIVVEPGPETEYANKGLLPANPSIWKPRVVDHSGPTEQLPRSIDDTVNTSLKKVAVIHMSLPK